MSVPRGFLVPAGAGRPTRVPVASTSFKAVGEDTDGAFTFLEYLMTYDMPPHTHLREHEDLYVLEGSVTVRVGDDEFSAGVGDFVLAPRGVPHAITATSDVPPRFLAISAPGPGLVDLNPSAGGWPAHQVVGAPGASASLDAGCSDDLPAVLGRQRVEGGHGAARVGAVHVEETPPTTASAR